MSRVKAKNTNLEKIVQIELAKRGFKFETHVKTLAGKPDIVLQRSRVAIFVDGDFWHGYRFNQWRSALPEFWQKKISQNRTRDQRNFRKLRRDDWKVIRVWQHEIKKDLVRAVTKITVVAKSRKSFFRERGKSLESRNAELGRSRPKGGLTV